MDTALTEDQILSFGDGKVPTGGANYEYYPLNREASGAITEVNSGNTQSFDTPSDTKYTAPLTPIEYTLSDLRNGEAYVTRASVFTEDTEVFDQ